MAGPTREQIMQATLAAIKEKLPDATIAKYKDYGNSADVTTISTGSLCADAVLGGGFARGRIIDIVGHTSAGKTTLALTACAELQKANPEANILYIDAECALDPKYAKALGVNMNGNFYLLQPNNGEEGYEAARMFINSGVADLVIIDSIAAMIPKAMLEVELGEQAQIGIGARLDSQGIASIYGPAHKNKTTVICINQWKKAVRTNAYDRTDGVSGNYYQPGGETFKFYLTQMIEVQRVGKVYDGDQLVSVQTRVRVLKNKIAPPGLEGDFFITFGVGVDRAQEVIELGLKTGDVERQGRSIYQIAGEDARFNGRQKFVEYLNQNPNKIDMLRASIKAKLFPENATDSITLDTASDSVQGGGAASPDEG